MPFVVLVALIPHTSKVKVKVKSIIHVQLFATPWAVAHGIFQARVLAKYCLKFSKQDFNSMWTVKFQMFKLDLENAEEPEIKLPTSVGSEKKQGNSIKASTSALLTIPKPFTVWIPTNWKIRKDMEYQTTWPASCKTCMQVKNQQIELDMEQ